MPTPSETAWQLLRDTYGSVIADKLKRGDNILFIGKNGITYSIAQGKNEASGIFLMNTDTCMKYCIELEDGTDWLNGEYPIADRLFTLLEYLRLNPDIIEEKAHKFVPSSHHEIIMSSAYLGRDEVEEEWTINPEKDILTMRRTIPKKTLLKVSHKLRNMLKSQYHFL